VHQNNAGSRPSTHRGQDSASCKECIYVIVAVTTDHKYQTKRNTNVNPTIDPAKYQIQHRNTKSKMKLQGEMHFDI